MQTTQRHAESGVIRHLFAEPYRYQFVQAIRILLHWLRQHGVSYEQALSQVLHFQNSPSLNFPASEIEHLSLQPDSDTIIVTPAFIGFLGGSGTLPLHYSQRIAAYQLSTKDAGVSAFLDIFSHRMVVLFFQAWGKYRLEDTFATQARDAQLPLLLALAGVQRHALPACSDDGAVTQDVAAWYAGLLRSRPVSAHAMSRMLAEYCAVPVTLQQFTGGWDYLPKNRLSIVGSSNFTLARGATLGLRLWRHDRRVQIDIGPLREADLQRFLPRGAGAQALSTMLALSGVPDLQYEVRLILSQPCITALVLSTRLGQQQRLGWTTFLASTHGQARSAEVRYRLPLS